MKKKITSVAAIALVSVLCAGALAGCGGKKGPTGDPLPDMDVNYTYTKQNNEGLMQFYSSDQAFDSFINEYMRRHLRYDEYSIGDLKVGEGSTVWKEWDAMSVMWMNTAGIGYSPKATVNNWISSITQDAFGYIWMDNGTTTTDWGQSWEFPNMGHSYYVNENNDVIFLNTSYLNGQNNINNYRNGSNQLSSIWKATSSTGKSGTLSEASTHFYDSLYISDSDLRWVTFTYEQPENNTIVYDGEDYEVKPLMATPFCSPFLEIDLSITDNDSLGFTEQVQDVIVSWKGGSKTKNTEWDAEHSVSYKDFSSNYKETFSSATHIVLPMYANEYWGTSQELSDAITDMKIEVIFKNGINGEVRLEEVTLAFDGRQINNNGVFVATAAYYYQYTQDDEWLAANIDRIRKAMQFYFTYCGAPEAVTRTGGKKEDVSALITTERLVGHDGSSNYDYFGDGSEKFLKTSSLESGAKAKCPVNYKAVGRGIGDGYWDAVNNPCINLYTNTYYYKALKGMLYLERMAAAANVTGGDVSVKNADMTGDVKYAETPASLQSKIDAFTEQFRTYFWNDETGRFVLGYLADDDPGLVANAVEKTVDYGFTTYNQEAIELGLASQAQAKTITEWINEERLVEGDTAYMGGTKVSERIYRFEFAPRWTTKSNTYQFWYRFDGSAKGTYGWNKQVQNGGTALHCAYYDLVAENAVNGADASFSKLKKIQVWYEKVAEKEGEGKNFYRNYYKTISVTPQGGGAGVVGVDTEFIEAALLYTSIPTAFFGLSSTDHKVLNITPNLPAGLDYWKMENLAYGNIYYDLSIGSNWVQINSVQGDATGLKVRVTLPKPDYDFTIRQHSTTLTEGTDYVVQGDRVVITTALKNGRIQFVKRAAAAE